MFVPNDTATTSPYTLSTRRSSDLAAHGSREVVVLPTPGAAGPRPHAGHLAIDLADAGPGGGAPAAGNPRCVPEQPALADRAADDPRRRPVRKPHAALLPPRAARLP